MGDRVKARHCSDFVLAGQPRPGAAALRYQEIRLELAYPESAIVALAGTAPRKQLIDRLD